MGEFKEKLRWVEEDRGHETPCWIWQLAQLSNGYGVEGTAEGNTLAHRRAYLNAYGPIPEGLEIDHLCRVRLCVRPEHLEAVTHQTNLRRGAGTKLTADDVREIRSLHRPAYEDLMARYGVSWYTIRDLRTKQRTSWKEVDA